MSQLPNASGPTGSGGTDYNLVDTAFTRNPFPTYQRILAEAPVHWNRSVNGWFVARYTDVAALLRDPRLSANRFAPLLRVLPPAMRERLATIARVSSKWTVLMDPPEHTRLRSLTSVGFTPRVAEGLRPQIQRLTHQLVDTVESTRTMDVVRDCAALLPAAVMAQLIGVAFDHHERFALGARTLARFFAATALDDALLTQITRDLLDLESYLLEIVTERRREPRSDLISHLITARLDGESLSDEEIVAECILLVIAGQETTGHAITNGLLLLLEHPGELARLRTDPSLWRSAVEEILRYTGPFQRLGRTALAPLEIGGHTIAAGDLVWLGLGTANRDPTQFREPDRFDIARADNKHLAFGYGVHFCEGAALARQEIQIALEVLLQRMPDLRLAVPADELRWVESTNMRSLVSLPITF